MIQSGSERELSTCRVCGYQTRSNRCPHCGCGYLIDKNFDRCNEKKRIDWENVKVSIR